MVLLLCEILHGVPSLPGAACRGRWELFDRLTGATIQQQRAERQPRGSAPDALSGWPAPTVTTT